MRNSLCLLGLILAAAPAAASQPEVRSTAAEPSSAAIVISSGVEYEEGDFGTGQRVKTTSIQSSIGVRKGQVQVYATLPYVRVDAPGNVVTGGGGLLGLPIIVDPDRPATRNRREGLGDMKLGAEYTVPSRSVGLTVSGQVKVPTASASKGLGTGKADYALGAELSKTLSTVTPFAGVGYTISGDPEDLDLRNSLSARAGAAVQMGPQVRGHVSYGYAQSLSHLVPNEQQVTGGINANVSQRVGLGVYGSAGLSEGAPDMGLGVHIRFRGR